MSAALYGPGGFYRRERPAAHFRTSVHASPLFAAAIGRLAAAVDDAIGRPDPFDVLDVGAGGGELLAAVGADAPPRWRLRSVDLDDALPNCVVGLVVANEWLDNVPCEVVERTDAGVRVVLEDDSLDGAPTAADLAWLNRWWPLADVGHRAEVGRGRDDAWAGVVARMDRGVALAIDYAHAAASRPAYGSLCGYRAGRLVAPVADGSCDLTAHVALDACAAAASAEQTLLTTQRSALRALGVTGARPSYAGDPVAHLHALARAGDAAELLDPGGLGGFGWLLQAKGMALPPILSRV